MAVKKCCILNCKSCSTRKEDKGVTYHKFPKNVALCDSWRSVSHIRQTRSDLRFYVCSRHFCKNDFQTYKDSKYILKSDAVPSIFPWSKKITKKIMKSESKMDTESVKDPESKIASKSVKESKDVTESDNVTKSKKKMEPEVSSEEPNEVKNTSSSSKGSEIESVDAIKKFIESQEKELQEQKTMRDSPSLDKNNEDSMDSKASQSETISVASSVIDMIISESELELARKREKNKVVSPVDKASDSMAISVGSRVEARDFSEEWYNAEIIEVDCDEMEVLVHYETETKKHDEWISVNSPRLRPAGSGPVKPGPSSIESITSETVASEPSVVSTPIPAIKEEAKDVGEDKAKLTYVVGERCLARWRDNRRFMATVHKDLGNGVYEVIFDDGCHWNCSTSRLYKLKPGKEGVTSGAPNTAAITPEQSGSAPVTPQAVTTYPYPAYHTHLFDPTRDYLGSKSERREKKRKLNIKEIFNIGQKKAKIQKTEAKPPTPKAPVPRKPRILQRKTLKKPAMKTEIKADIPASDAVASIIGTINHEVPLKIKQEPLVFNKIESTKAGVKDEPKFDDTELPKDKVKKRESKDDDKVELDDLKPYLDPDVLDEEVKLEQFEKPDEVMHEEVIDRIKEVINKLENGISRAEHTNSPKLELKLEIPKLELKVEQPEVKPESLTPKLEEKSVETSPEIGKENKKSSKVKKGKKLRLLREKKVKKQVEKVKSELEAMRRQVEEMRMQMLKSQDMPKQGEMPETFLLEGEWCCRWVNGQPLGMVSEIECDLKPDASGKPPLPRRSVQVEDKRLPEGWTKHMVRRSLGHSAGKWDVVLINPENRRFHTKNEMRVYLENNPDKELQSYEHALTDFGVHMKLARRMGWISHTPDGLTDGPNTPLPVGLLSSTSPLVKRKSLGLKKKAIKMKRKVPKLTIKMKTPYSMTPHIVDIGGSTQIPGPDSPAPLGETGVEQLNVPLLEDGYVYVGALKVQIIENLLRCPAEGCFKNFRNNTLLQMHIKHYHRELQKMLGATPKVLDLAYARTMPVELESPKSNSDQKLIKVKIHRPTKPKPIELEPKLEVRLDKMDIQVDSPTTPVKDSELPVPRSQDSPKLRQALINKPVKRPRVLLPVRRLEPELAVPDSMMSEELDFETENIEPLIEIPEMDSLDFETAISTHTVTKPFESKIFEKKRKGEKKRKCFVLPPKGPVSEEEDWFGMNSDVDTRSSFPGSGTPDSKVDSKAVPVSSESNEENKEVNNMYMFNETGERIKIVHMKREEIINCHCGFREEDGLMVQCELCLCWQHALCHNIQRETDVPEKYTCSICLHPRRGRRSRRFAHAQERLYEGQLPGAKPCEWLRRSHELSANLLRIDDALNAMRIKYYVAVKKDHPKLYLWAKDWEHAEIQFTQEKLNSDYSDLNIMISSIGKENLPIKPDDMTLDMRTSPCEENDHDRYLQRDVALGSQSLLSGLLSSPGGASLDLPISTSELERLAKSVQEQELQRMPIAAPQPEAAIENGACRQRLLTHLQRCQALLDARLDSIEAQVAELESQDPSFEDDETADYFPRTKQTIQMLMRDLDTMEELGVIT